MPYCTAPEHSSRRVKLSHWKEKNLRVILVTAADAKYFGYASEMIRSVKPFTGGLLEFGFMDLGITDADRQWLADNDVRCVEGFTRFDTTPLREVQRYHLGYLARPFLRDHFPGYDVYVWMDADAWLQKAEGLDDLISEAARVGGVFIRENDKSYRFTNWLLGWRAKHFLLGAGPLSGAWLWTRPHINNGVFALRGDAPHWQTWQRRYQRAINRTHRPSPHDQFCLNATVYLDGHKSAFLPATRNWICDLATPVWDEERKLFCVPYAPFEPIAVVHLAGLAKTAVLDIPTTTGHVVKASLRFRGGAGRAEDVAKSRLTA